MTTLALTTAGTTHAADALTGDTKLACEAIICLSTGQQPSECTPSLKRYFSISYKKWKDTLKGRTNFLKLCPAVSMDSKMGTLVNDIANGAGRCDAASLNASNTVWNYDDGTYYIEKNQPAVCKSYNNNGYTNLKETGPKYVGTPANEGYWVNGADYDKALAEYTLKHPVSSKKYWE
ncbi:MAG: TrbM/KikA/MpfK family conjugal transfer protein [bacterium]|nr:TrbM/KikA/MpfK family conjugal transfer protein [bacterium]